jgi:hypothetical protein
MRWKNMEGQSVDSLFLRGCSVKINRPKSSSGISKYKGRSESPGMFTKVCWRCGKEGYYKKKCRSKSVERGKRSEYAPYTEEKTSKEEGGDL